jgi:hypothetical protein
MKARCSLLCLVAVFTAAFSTCEYLIINAFQLVPEDAIHNVLAIQTMKGDSVLAAKVTTKDLNCNFLDRLQIIEDKIKVYAIVVHVHQTFDLYLPDTRRIQISFNKTKKTVEFELVQAAVPRPQTSFFVYSLPVTVEHHWQTDLPGFRHPNWSLFMGNLNDKKFMLTDILSPNTINYRVFVDTLLLPSENLDLADNSILYFPIDSGTRLLCMAIDILFTETFLGAEYKHYAVSLLAVNLTNANKEIFKLYTSIDNYYRFHSARIYLFGCLLSLLSGLYFSCHTFPFSLLNLSLSGFSLTQYIAYNVIFMISFTWYRFIFYYFISPVPSRSRKLPYSCTTLKYLPMH